MSCTVTRSSLIRLAHPLEGVLPKQNHLAQMTRPMGSAGEHLLAQLWPADNAPDSVEKTCEHAKRETELADLLRTMRDESQDIKVRIEAAEGALRIKDAQSLTINIVKYAKGQDTIDVPQLVESMREAGMTLEDALDKMESRVSASDK
jgi:hypothetical protein